ncbi:putative lipid II flippase FtsW [Patescibacteria group bacterium]|nr:putative lipid II flippase FtsW [Patescibacteria group bacterium]
MAQRSKIRNQFLALLLKPFSYRYYQHKPDYNFIITLGIIIFFGLLILSSASSIHAFQKFGDSYWFVKHQILNGVLPGLILFFFASQLDYRKWKKCAFWMLAATIGLLILVFIPGIGVSHDKARSWIALGPLSFQPAEVIKFTFLVYLATWLEQKGQKGLKDVQYGLMPFLFTLGTITFLILAQPDLGTLLIVIALSVIVYFVAGAPWKHILGIMIIGFIIIFIAIQVAPYRLNRITAFFNPEVDPQGISYHSNQAKLAIGSGGIFGLGMGKSRQKFNYLPEVSGDSIFAVFAEELGLIFSLLLLYLFFNLASRGIKIARGSPDEFGKLLTIGAVGWITFQALVNIGAMVGLVPLTGLPLPFISSGGSAMAVAMFSCGVVVNISKQTR